MAVLSLGVTEGASVEKPELADITETYDFSDEAAVNEYTSGITLDTIHENLTAAGVPEELITQILSGSTEETPAAEEAPAA